jgi:glycosyltransferase involved in cell wall biosynthesis
MVAENIKILYYTDPTAFQVFGGAEVQLLKTKEYLIKANLNLSVKLFDVFKDKLDKYDILHVFGMRYDCLPIFKLAKAKGLKLVLSPIYWPEAKRPKSIVEGMGSIGQFLSNFFSYRYVGTKKLSPFKEFLDTADVFLPNSMMEAEVLSREFSIDHTNFFVVPNAVDKRNLGVKPDIFVKKYGVKDFVLYVGRIERRKNNLRLLEAMKTLSLPLVIIGHPNPWEREYFAQFEQEAKHNPNVHIIGFLPSDSKELLSAYAAAKVFVLPSLFETPGLAALEAGAYGCNLAITNGGSTKEYFGNHAFYFNPQSTKEIQTGIINAYTKPKRNELRDYIIEHFTWEKVAEKTMLAYKWALENR